VPRPTRLDIAYAAGFFDGEGSIVISLSKKGYLRLEVSSSQNLPPVLMWHEKKFGGKVYHPRNHASQWKIHGKYAIPFLLTIAPYCIVKAPDIEEAINIWQAYQSGQDVRPLIQQRKLRREYANRLSVEGT
jgi:hypothetical protein